MPPKTTASAPWQDLETQAYHAFREWPIWLVLRERELAERLTSGQSDKRTPGAAPAGEADEDKSSIHGEQPS
jgi:hypothetical protein